MLQSLELFIFVLYFLDHHIFLLLVVHDLLLAVLHFAHIEGHVRDVLLAFLDIFLLGLVLFSQRVEAGFEFHLEQLEVAVVRELLTHVLEVFFDLGDQRGGRHVALDLSEQLGSIDLFAGFLLLRGHLN